MSLSLAPSLAGAAPGLPEVLTRPIFRLVLESTLPGARLASEVLGREVTAVSGAEYGETLAVLAQPRNEALARKLAERVSKIEALAAKDSGDGLVNWSQLPRIRELADWELSLVRASQGQIRFVNGGESFAEPLGFASESETFLRAAKEARAPRWQSAKYSWRGRDRRPEIKPPLVALRNDSILLERARLAMRLDGSRDSLARLGEAMFAYRRAVDRLEETLSFLENAGPLNSDERAVLEKMITRIEESEVVNEAQSYLLNLRPASFEREVNRYLDSVVQFERLRQGFPL